MGRTGYYIFCLLVAVGLLAGPAQAALIETADIMAIPAGVTGSGNGTLDLRMFTFSGSEITNVAEDFNGDNGNNTLPNSGGDDTNGFVESYVTTAGELKAFYILNFPPDSVHEIMLCLDLNETGGGMPNNTFISVDLPAPFSPSSAWISPGRMRIETSLSTGFSP